MMLTAIAGPLSNLLLAAVSIGVLVVLILCSVWATPAGLSQESSAKPNDLSDNLLCPPLVRPLCRQQNPDCFASKRPLASTMKRTNDCAIVFSFVPISQRSKT